MRDMGSLEVNQSIPTMLTIKETASRTGVSYDFIRKLCLSRKIVHVRAGTKYLINFEKFVDFLNGEVAEQ